MYIQLNCSVSIMLTMGSQNTKYQYIFYLNKLLHDIKIYGGSKTDWITCFCLFIFLIFVFWMLHTWWGWIICVSLFILCWINNPQPNSNAICIFCLSNNSDYVYHRQHLTVQFMHQCELFLLILNFFLNRFPYVFYYCLMKISTTTAW